MAFAEIPPAKVLAIPRSQQFAEKIHAYSKRWNDRENMRTKDLVDFVLLIETGSVKPGEVAVAAKRTFDRRATHGLPEVLPKPPAVWASDITALAAEA
jgi:hypothetical protein